MAFITRDSATDHMNYIQFADAAWLGDLNYQDYKASAQACDKHVLTEQQYISHCASLDVQAAEYNK
jgi:hypothetical protein